PAVGGAWLAARQAGGSVRVARRGPRCRLPRLVACAAFACRLRSGARADLPLRDRIRQEGVPELLHAGRRRAADGRRRACRAGRHQVASHCPCRSGCHVPRRRVMAAAVAAGLACASAAVGQPSDATAATEVRCVAGDLALPPEGAWGGPEEGTWT